MDSILAFVLLWGVWLLTPILVDGLDAVGRWIVLRRHPDPEPTFVADEELPSVSVIVPAHNEAEVIDRCLSSIRAQRYPYDRFEVIVIDDGSTDDTADRAEEHANGWAPDARVAVRGERIVVGPFDGRFEVVRNGHSGKACALNAGIELSRGEIIVNVDSDVVLAPDAVRALAEAFVRDPEMGAATGDIEIDWDLIYARDENGDIALDEDAWPVRKRLTLGERFLSKSQFLEYLSSFRLGRHAQAVTDSMYSLAGACSAFRRHVLADHLAYRDRTVSEDTDITWELHRRGVRVGFVPTARVLLEPITKWDELYAQRVRWARGQLEVASLNDDIIGDKDSRAHGSEVLEKLLVFDHTLAFPRLIWAPLILFFPLLGYSWTLIALALFAMYVLYVLIEVANTLACYSSVAEEDTRERVELCTWNVLVLPAYRFVVFHFRFSGFLVALTEEQRWTVPGVVGPTRSRLDVARLRAIEIATMAVRLATRSLSIALRAAAGVAAPLLVALAVVVDAAASWRKSG